MITLFCKHCQSASIQTPEHKLTHARIHAHQLGWKFYNPVLNGKPMFPGPREICPKCVQFFRERKARKLSYTVSACGQQLETNLLRDIANQVEKFLRWFEKDGKPCDGFRFREDQAKLRELLEIRKTKLKEIPFVNRKCSQLKKSSNAYSER